MNSKSNFNNDMKTEVVEEKLQLKNLDLNDNESLLGETAKANLYDDINLDFDYEDMEGFIHANQSDINKLLDDSVESMIGEAITFELDSSDGRIKHIPQKNLIKSNSPNPDTTKVNYIEYFDHIKQKRIKLDKSTDHNALINSIGIWNSDLGRYTFNHKDAYLSMRDLHTKYNHIHTVTSFTGVNAVILKLLMSDCESFRKIKKHKNSVTGYVYIEPSPLMMRLPLFRKAYNNGLTSIIRLSIPRAKSARHRRCIMPVLNLRDNTFRLCVYKVKEKETLLEDFCNYSKYYKECLAKDSNTKLTLLGVNKSVFSTHLLAACFGPDKYVISDPQLTDSTFNGHKVIFDVVKTRLSLTAVDYLGQSLELTNSKANSIVIANAKTSKYKHDVMFDSNSILLNGEKGFSFIAGTVAVIF